MAYLESNRRVGRSQAASIFWGLVSVFFAAAACYYFWKNHENETSTNVLRDQVLTLQEQREALSSQRDKLQAGISDTDNQLKTREDFLNEKEAKLAQEESQIESMGQQSQAQQSATQAPMVKKFNDAVRKLIKDNDTDVVVRGGRPVLRVPASVFFAFGEASLKPGGKALLTQLAQALNGQLDGFELRVETFSDTDGEIPDASQSALAPPPDNSPAKPDTTGKDATKDVPDKNHYTTSWDLTGARAGALARFLHEQTSLSFQNIIVVPRGDFQPIVPTGGEGHARNRRVEITIAPVPMTYHSVDATRGDTGGDVTPKPHAADKPSKSEKSAKAEKTDKADKTEKSDSGDKSDKNAKSTKTN